MSELTPPAELFHGWPEDGLRWRLSTFRVRAMFDGNPHLLQPGVDYPEWAATEDVVKKLNNAAFYRKTQLHIVAAPAEAGVWVRSETDLTGFGKDATLMRQIETLTARVKELEEELSLLKTA